MKETKVEQLVDTRYRLVREIARGGSGTVFEAHHEFTGRPVALKMLRPEQADVAEHQARLLREAQALYLAKHPNVVDVLDAGLTRSGHVYVATELIEGRTLSGLLAARSKLSVEHTLGIGRQVGAALELIHSKGLIHRDVKPDNLLLQGDSANSAWRVKLVDFGAARVKDNQVKLTKTGQIVGTPEYMAPEQLMGEDVDHRVDIYALGVTLYECLTGSVPFPGTYAQVLLAVSSGNFPPIYEVSPDVPKQVSQVIQRAVAQKANDRFDDVASFLTALEAAAGLAPAKADPTESASKPSAAEAAIKRRVFARASYMTPVRLLIGEDTPCDGRTEDISKGGVLVFLEYDIDTDQRVRLRFALPITGKVVEVDALAKWSRAQRGRRVTGLEFMSLPPDAGEAIERYVKLMGAPPA